MNETDSGVQTSQRATGSDEPPKLSRSNNDRMLAGVCGGIGEYFGVDAIWFRLGFVILAVGGGSSALVYGLLWLIVPEQSGSDVERRQRRPNPPAALIVGLALIAFGTMVLVDMIDQSIGRFFWPSLLVVAGLLLIAGGRSHDRN